MVEDEDASEQHRPVDDMKLVTRSGQGEQRRVGLGRDKDLGVLERGQRIGRARPARPPRSAARRCPPTRGSACWRSAPLSRPLLRIRYHRPIAAAHRASYRRSSAERPNGEPSATDFIVPEFPPIVERFATDFEALAEIIDGVPAGRMLITSGVLVRAVAVFGLATSDSSIDLIGVTVERGRRNCATAARYRRVERAAAIARYRRLDAPRAGVVGQVVSSPRGDVGAPLG